jgi:hypothetical protein
LTPRIFATLVFRWFAHAVANRCCIYLLHLFGRATLCSQWPICVMIKFLQEHHNPVQLSGRTICLEMLRNGLHASVVPGGSNAIHISSLFMRAPWSFCSGRMEASCSRCL